MERYQQIKSSMKIKSYPEKLLSLPEPRKASEPPPQTNKNNECHEKTKR